MSKNRGLYRLFFYFVFIMPVFLSCRHSPVEMPDGMYGRWKSSTDRPDITLGTDSIGYFAIVHHRINDGRVCPVRYPLHLSSPTKGYIRAEGCILFYYDSLKHTLYFSPGGDYAK